MCAVVKSHEPKRIYYRIFGIFTYCAKDYIVHKKIAVESGYTSSAIKQLIGFNELNHMSSKLTSNSYRRYGSGIEAKWVKYHAG